MLCTWFWCLVGGVLAPGKLLPRPKEAAADTLPKTSAAWLVEFYCASVAKSLNETVADPTWYSPQQQ